MIDRLLKIIMFDNYICRLMYKDYNQFCFRYFVDLPFDI